MTAPHATTAPHRAAFGALLYALALAATAAPAAAPLVTVPARASTGAGTLSFDGVVEAVRQTGIAAQVSGAVVQLDVKAGDRVRAGQLLLRIDARAADQASLASDAQVRAAQAAQDVATKEYERQQQLHAQRFISAAALDRARAEYQAALAQAQAQAAQAGAARTVSGLHIVRAPYAGVVSDVAVTLGDMALPGRPLLTLYDPQALRVSAAVPQTAVATLNASEATPVHHAAAGPGGLLLGLFAVLVTPREEEPQINVTMANVLIPFPGPAARRTCRTWWPARPSRCWADRRHRAHLFRVAPGPGRADGAVQGGRAAHRGAGAPVRHVLNANGLAAAGLGVLRRSSSPRASTTCRCSAVTLWSR
jgi:multidrug efflux pump subunit AcrA (membrane-fusion protein)